jgi:release factor glutamine methyltransferase
MPTTTVGSFLKRATQELSQAGVGTARLDALVLLEDAIGRDRTHLLAHPELKLTPAVVSKLSKQIARRTKHVPLAYIRGYTEFFGREFAIDQRVLEPRSESEAMLNLLKSLPLPEAPIIIDIGTGSGALAITAKLELPNARVLATDIDPGCLAVATDNARYLAADVKFYEGNLLEPVSPKQLDRAILLCNLPYVPDNFQINLAAMNEPRLAIFGGKDGLDLYRQLFAQIQERATKPTFILTESLPPQHDVLNRIALDHGFVLDQTDDFIQVFRMAADSSAS